MLDLCLFQLLRDEQLDDPRLPELLATLARFELRDRIPFLGYLVDLAGSDEARVELRSLAARALAGATGMSVVRVARKLSEHPELASSGVELFRALSQDQPGRWLYAAFHPDPAQRKAAYTGAVPDKAARFDLHLLMDEVVRPFALARLDQRSTALSGAEPALAIALLGDGVLPPALAFKLFQAGSFAGLTHPNILARPSASLQPWLKEATSPSGAPDPAPWRAERDDLDLFLSAMPESPAPWVTLANAVGARLAASAALRLAEADDDPRFAWGLFCASPLTLLGPLFSPARRRAVLDTLLQEKRSTPRIDGEALKLLLASPVVTDDAGRLEPRALAAILHLPKDKALASAITLLGAPALADTVARDPEGGVELLFVHDDDPPKLELLRALPQEPAVLPKVLAMFAERAPKDALPLLAKLPDVPGTFDALARRAVVTGERAQWIARVFDERLAAALLSAVVLPHFDAHNAPKPLITALLDRAVSFVPAEDLADRLMRAPGRALDRVLAWLDRGEPLPLGLEIVLTQRLRAHHSPAAQAWFRARIPVEEAPRPAPRKAGVAFLPPLGPASVTRCVEILGSIDPITATDQAFASSSRDEPAFLAELDRALVKAFAYQRDALSPLGHAMLWRFEFHAFAHLDALLAQAGGLAEGVLARASLVSRPLARESLLAVASALGMLAMRDRPRFLTLVDERLTEALTGLLATDVALGAAESLRALAQSRLVDLSGVLPAIRLALPDISDDARARLRSVVDDAGLERARLPARKSDPLDPDLLERTRTSSDLGLLAKLLSDPRAELVHEATLRLILHGDAGCEHLLHALTAGAPATRPILDSVPLWPDGDALAALRDLARSAALPLETRFRIALALSERGEPGAADLAVSALREPTQERFFESADWDALVTGLARDHGDREAASRAAAIALADSPHPRAHLRAVETLLAQRETADALEALRRFLACGTERMSSLRRRAAAALLQAGDTSAFPLCAAHVVDQTKGPTRLFEHADDALVVATTRGFLAAGPIGAKEQALLHHLRALPRARAEEALEEVLADAVNDNVRIATATLLSTGASRERKLRRLVDVFLWGQRLGQRLLGRRMRVKMTGSRKLGFTRTHESTVYVTPLPMLRGDRNGREVVEALILHELGHHIYHAGKDGDRVWAQAAKEGLHGLFNLVADEHLERNMRAQSADFGDSLKRLAAYAFQHTHKDVAIDRLLAHLGKSAHAVLVNTHLGVARDSEHVRVDSGSLMFGMEKQGLSFARFARALRMGLGNRHADPIVAQALAFFGPNFRHSTMDELLEITRKLRDLFGWETSLCDSFGPHESLEGAEDGRGNPDDVVWGEGISQEEIDRQIERFTEKGSTAPSTGAGGKIAINVNDDTRFNLIKRVEQKLYHPEMAAPYKRRVEHPASVLRGYLSELGLGFEAERARLSGKRLDRSRLFGLVVRGDPRVLVARKLVNLRDLFLGVVIDCSGSMQSGGNIEKAKLFATLVAEAAAPLDRVDVRTFGFTDQIIFDCGDARRSGVSQLAAGGGNNDAAALYHVAQVAKNSRRRAKVLVMISDGLPTECSVAALKNLVRQLASREGMVLAQVAVQPLAEVCFPHYVVLKDADITVTVRKFGGVIAGLVKRALGA